ncbi:MAG: protein-L-isoaspartate(D-aspartate) O-methyltransferase [Chloroflexota bacterium]
MPSEEERPEDRARRRMVADQLRRRGIADERVLAVMGDLPRERFLPPRYEDLAYADAAAPIDEGQTISQPYIVALMTELLRVAPGDRILEIGTGSGYQAAVLAGLGAKVTSIERFPALAEAARQRLAGLGIEGVEIRVADGSAGDPAGAPWDGIVVTAAAPAVPGPLREQLAIGARLVIPVGGRWDQQLLVIERRGPADWSETSGGAVVFVPLVGEQGYADLDDRERA